MLLGNGGLALRLIGSLLAPNSSGHDSSTRLLLLGRRCRAEDWFSLGLVDWGRTWGSAGIWGQIVGVLLELWRVGHCSALLLQLHLRKHLLLRLGRVHHPPSPTSSCCHLLELMVKGVLGGHAALRRHPTWLLLLLLDSRNRPHALLWTRRHGLSRGLGCWGLGSTRSWGTGRRGAIVPW